MAALVMKKAYSIGIDEPGQSAERLIEHVACVMKMTGKRGHRIKPYFDAGQNFVEGAGEEFARTNPPLGGGRPRLWTIPVNRLRMRGQGSCK